MRTKKFPTRLDHQVADRFNEMRLPLEARHIRNFAERFWSDRDILMVVDVGKSELWVSFVKPK